MAKRLAILDDYQNFARDAADWSVLGDDVEIEVFNDFIGHDDAAVIAALEPFSILVCMRERTPLPAARIEALPNLELIVTTGMRNLAFDMNAARAKGIDVCGTAMLPYPAAEHAMALIMDLSKRISMENRVMHDGGWQAVVAEGLNGKRLGLLGLGKLSQRVAEFGQALEMDVVAWSENLTEENELFESLDQGEWLRGNKTGLTSKKDLGPRVSYRADDVGLAWDLGMLGPGTYLLHIEMSESRDNMGPWDTNTWTADWTIKISQTG